MRPAMLRWRFCGMSVWGRYFLPDDTSLRDVSAKYTCES
jgi:hypothetical protein